MNNYQEMCDHLVSEVVSHGGREPLAIKNKFKIDLENYSWVENFLKDLKKRNEIEKLNQEIVQAKHHTLIGKEEVKRGFIEWQAQTKKEFLDLIQRGLVEIQGRRGEMDGLPMDAEDRLFRCLHVANLTDSEIEGIFKDIPEGISQQKIDEKVKDLERQIGKINEGLQKSLSLKERWIYNESGSPLPYPQGCRWTIFVEAWERVQSRFSQPCTVEGLALSTDSEKRSWKLLQMDEVQKNAPQRKPFEM